MAWNFDMSRIGLSRWACLVALLAVVGVCGCGGKQQEAENDEEFDTPAARYEATHFTVNPDAKPFFGRTPFKVKFTTETKNAKGKVRYEWKFADGTEPSSDSDPTHTFEKPGLYTVNVVGTDESGEQDGGAVIIRALTDEQAKAMQAEYDAKGIDYKIP